MKFAKYFDESSNKTLISVDIQPEYYYKKTKFGGFKDDILNGLIEALNSDEYNRKIVLYNGHDTLGMINENDYKMWLLENGLEEDKLDECIFYDKGYAFFRFCLDSGIDEEDIVKLVKFMGKHNINDSRQIKESELWDEFMQEYDRLELRELLEDADDCINIPDLMDWLSTRARGQIDLIGGGQNECLKEVEIALQAMGIDYNKNDSLIYETMGINEMSYSRSDIPKRFYLAINFSMWDNNIDQKVGDLLKGELKGVKGISGSGIKAMVRDWGNMRELMISMPSEELMRLNKLSRVMYDNPEYLASNGMKVLRRLFNETGDTYSSIFTKMQGYLLRSMDDPTAKGKIDYNGSIIHLDQHISEFGKIKDIKDLVNFILSHIEDNDGYLKGKGFDWWRKVVESGLKKMGEVYNSEKEWLVKGNSLIIPRDSKIYVVEPTFYKDEYEKSISPDKNVQWFADKKEAEKYVRWLELVKRIESGYRVEKVPEKYVGQKKLDLVKANRSQT